MKKERNPNNDKIYDSLMFCIKEELLKEFLTTSNIRVTPPEEEIKNSVSPMSDCLVAVVRALEEGWGGRIDFTESLPLLKIVGPWKCVAKAYNQNSDTIKR